MTMEARASMRELLLTLAVLAALGGSACASGDDTAGRDSLIPLPALESPAATFESTVTVAETVATTADTTTGSSSPASVPPFQAPDCGEITGDELYTIVASFRPDVDGRSGFSIAAAAGIDDADGVRYLVGSIYDATGFRVSTAETWAVVDGEMYAYSRSAIEHSTLPDGREVLDGPEQGFRSKVRAMLEACVTQAL
jgi:hypothetical protein